MLLVLHFVSFVNFALFVVIKFNHKSHLFGYWLNSMKGSNAYI
jgi:hypothetical protein